jgi:excinuclease ABC subunit C
MGQPIRMRPAFVAIAGKPAPNVRVAHRVSSRYSTAYGPITGTGRLKEAVDCLNQVFRLRDCSDQTKFNFGNQLTLFDEPANAACIRHELGSCPGPCAGLCSSAAYGRHLQAAVRFLEGESGGILRDLENAMTAAAAERKFETAASYRDRLSNLAWLDNRLAGLRLANQQLSGILPVESTNKRKSIWLVLRGGRIRETLAAPSTPLCMQTATAAINQIAREPDSLPTDLLDISLQLIVISWFRKNPSQLEKIIPFSAMSSCILSAAAVVPTTHTPPHSASPAPVGKP